MAAAELPLWTPEERESFFAAIARHRRAAWQVSAVAGVCIAILAFALLCVAIYLLVMVSIGLSGLFTFFPAILLHMILR